MPNETKRRAHGSGPCAMKAKNHTMNCDLLNGILGGLAASTVTVILYFVERRSKRRGQLSPERLQLVKALSVQMETLRRLLYVVNMYLVNDMYAEPRILDATKKRFIDSLVAIQKLQDEHPLLLDKRTKELLSDLRAAVVEMHNFPSDVPSVGRSLADGRRLHDDVEYQLDVVEGRLRHIVGSD